MSKLSKLIEAAAPKQVGLSVELIDTQMKLARYLMAHAKEIAELIKAADRVNQAYGDVTSTDNLHNMDFPIALYALEKARAKLQGDKK